MLSIMTLNICVEVQSSLELSSKFLERSKLLKKANVQRAMADSLCELSLMHRYQGQNNDASKFITASFELNNLNDCLTTILHDLGILEVKNHNLDNATTFYNNH